MTYGLQYGKEFQNSKKIHTMYIKQTLSILYYRKLKKKNKKTGTVPVYVRLTIDGLQDEISTGVTVQPDHWSQEGQEVHPVDPEAKEKNKVLKNMTTDLERHFDMVKVQQEVATPQAVFKAYKTPLRAQKTKEEQLENLAFSEALDDLIFRYLAFNDQYEKAHVRAQPPHPTKTLLLEHQKEALKAELKILAGRGNQIFDDPDWEKTMMLAVNEHLLHFMELAVAGERSPHTLEKMWGRKKRYIDFLQFRYAAIDLPLQKVHFKMTDQLLTYNITEHKMVTNSAMKYVQTLKEVLTRATSLGWVPANIFDAYHCHYDETDRKWPTPEMFNEFRQNEFETPLQNLVRDCYVCGCYTGYAYAELYTFAPDEITVGIDGKRWGGKNRQKTGIEETLPLLPIVEDIIEKYKGHRVCVLRGKCLPIPCNTVYNRELKKMAAQMGWRIKLDGHTSRYFFVNEVAFNNGITSLKTLMKIMGIKSIKTLMVYLKGNKQSISEGMQMVEEKIFHPDGSFKSRQPATAGGEGARVIALRTVR